MGYEFTTEMGRTYKSVIFPGIAGVCTSQHRYMTGCNRVCLQWEDKGEIKEHHCDENTLELVEEKPSLMSKIKKVFVKGDDAKEEIVGGPQTIPPARSTGH